MSHDILLRHTSSTPSAADDLFTGHTLGPSGGNGLGAPGGHQPPPTPAQKIHRLLKGRYPLAIVLALLGGVAGAAAGYFTQEPTMVSEGLIQIDPVTRGVLSSEKAMPQFERFIMTQPRIIMSPRVISAAAETQDWRSTGIPFDQGVDMLRSGVQAAYQKGTTVISIAFANPEGRVAQAGTRALVTAYANLFNETNNAQLQDEIRQVDDRIGKLRLALQVADREIQSIAEQHGTRDLSIRHDLLQRNMEEYAASLNNIQFMLKQAQESLAKEPGKDMPELTPQDIAISDEAMRQFLASRKETAYRLEMLKLRGFGENHRDVSLAQKELALLDKTIEDYANDWRTKFRPPVTDGINQFTPSEMYIWQLQQQQQALQERYDEHVQKTMDLGSQRTRIMQLESEIALARDELSQMERLRELKMDEASRTGMLTVIDSGSAARTDGDKRTQMAMVGFAGGSALPIAALVLWGLLFPKYRYSEETRHDMSGLTLLGILPNLPDRLTDPEQAATAAHCVHQIRTMLQISNPADRHVFAITSASPTEGKTSLTLALGLSFAASGSRTLLIDCDLVGAGLTARLDMTGPEGVLEAMTSRSLLDYVRTTDIADLSILPVGMAQPHHAGLFSPAALGRLLAEAKRHFEVVLIDTGPILGSIEATPVAAASDAVILCVKRGKERPLVERALGHLQQIGARFAGVVFNRAQASDFEASISGMSLRSVSRSKQTGGGNGNGHGGGARGDGGTSKTFGPVARAVASSSFRNDGDDDPAGRS